jgi:hypothetical protein
MMRDVSMEEASRLGKTSPLGEERSRTVIFVPALVRAGLRARERAVLRPKTPAPTMRMLEGIGGPFLLLLSSRGGELEEEGGRDEGLVSGKGRLEMAGGYLPFYLFRLEKEKKGK